MYLWLLLYLCDLRHRPTTRPTHLQPRLPVDEEGGGKRREGNKGESLGRGKSQYPFPYVFPYESLYRTLVSTRGKGPVQSDPSPGSTPAERVGET